MTLEDRLVSAFQRVAATVGLEQDWAAQFAGLLNAPAALAAATKALPGLMRFATDTEATAATIDTVAITPKQALALLRANPRTFATVVALGAATGQPEGTLATVGRYAISSGIFHRASLWQMTYGVWTPLVEIAVEAADNTGELAALNSVQADAVASGIAIVPPGTRARGVVTGNQWFWSSTSKWLQTNLQPLFAATSGFTTVSGFNVLPLVQPSGRAAEWAAGTPGYLVPQDGWYTARMAVRFPDGVTTGWNIGVGIQVVGNETYDGNFIKWQSVPASANGASVNRLQMDSQRTFQLTKGQIIKAVLYIDGGNVTLGTAAGILEVTPVRG